MGAHTSVYENWSQTLTGLLRCQWSLLDAHFRMGMDLVKAMEPAAAPGPSPSVAGEGFEELERRGAALTARGLPPPKELYEVQNRSRVDWSRFPEWARPVDPEVFDGSGHEG
jgi:hypothetical protein